MLKKKPKAKLYTRTKAKVFAYFLLEKERWLFKCSCLKLSFFAEGPIKGKLSDCNK